MNLRWRESVNYCRSYASLKCYVGEIRKMEIERERETNKQYESRMLIPFDINLIRHTGVCKHIVQKISLIPHLRVYQVYGLTVYYQITILNVTQHTYTGA